MRTHRVVLLTALAAGWLMAVGEARPARDGASGAGGPVRDSTGAIVADTSLSFRVQVGSRLYPDWKEEQTVKLNQIFYLGDQPFTAVLKAFMSDFKIIDGKWVNVAPTLTNPAAFVVVYADTGATDSTWAFLNFPPHFSPRSFFTFKLLAVEGYEEPAAGEKKGN